MRTTLRVSEWHMAPALVGRLYRQDIMRFCLTEGNGLSWFSELIVNLGLMITVSQSLAVGEKKLTKCQNMNPKCQIRNVNKSVEDNE